MDGRAIWELNGERIIDDFIVDYSGAAHVVTGCTTVEDCSVIRLRETSRIEL